jgi:hypothetical protein
VAVNTKPLSVFSNCKAFLYIPFIRWALFNFVVKVIPVQQHGMAAGAFRQTALRNISFSLIGYKRTD